MPWLARVAAELVTIAAALWLADAAGLWAWWPAAIVVGTRMHGLAILGHVASHREALPWPAANDAAARLVLGLLGIGLRRYRRFHGLHHAYLGEEPDPEVKIAETFRARWAYPHRWEMSVCDALGLHSDELAAIILRIGAPLPLLVFTGIGCALAWHSLPAGLAWLAAPSMGFMLAHRLRASSEHDHINLPGYTFRLQRPPLWRRVLYLPHGTWLHAEHHDQVAQWAPALPSTLAEVETDTGRLV